MSIQSDPSPLSYFTAPHAARRRAKRVRLLLIVVIVTGVLLGAGMMVLYQLSGGC